MIRLYFKSAIKSNCFLVKNSYHFHKTKCRTMDVTQSVSSHKSLWAGLILTESEVRGLGRACLLPTDTGCQSHRAQTTGQTRGEKQKGKTKRRQIG